MSEDRTPQAEFVAAQLLDAVPLLMRALRRQLRVGASEGLSVPQFHALIFLRKHPGAGLSEVADYVGATLPTMSELVNRMVAAGYVERATNPAERRRVCLTVTSAGEAVIDATMRDARQTFSEMLARLDSNKLRRLEAALSELREILAPEG